MTSPPDVFKNVHKGIRNALFDICVRIGRAESGDRAKWEAVKDRTREVLRFIDLHGENEDLLLLPLIASRAPEYYQRMRTAHAELDDVTAAVREALDEEPRQLYHAACTFTAAYLEHMREEELEHLPVLHIHLSPDELHGFQRRAVARTAPTEQNLLLSYMLSAMTDSEVASFLEDAARTAPDEILTQIKRVAVAARKGLSSP